MTSPWKQHKVLFVHNDNPKDPLSSFFLHDIDILQQYYEVEVLSLYPYKHGHLDALASPAVWKAVMRNDAVFGWFGSSAPVVMMASLLRKPSVIVAGGADVVYVPEIDYGLNPARKIAYTVYRLGYRLARRVLLFSESSKQDYLRLPGSDPERAQRLYLGVDSDHFHPSGEKRPQVLTISYIAESVIRRKGILTLLNAARLTPEIPYRIAGLVLDREEEQKLIAFAPPNVAFLGYLSDEQLLREMQSSKVYAQLSYHEGFGMAVAEAMACGCLPVVTNRGSLPEVAGDAGYYVPVDDAAAAAAAFRAAIAEGDATKGDQARQRIMDLFRPSDREFGIHAVMEEVFLS